MKFASHDSESMSENWSIMKRSTCRQSFDAIEDFEDLNNSAISTESVKVRSISLPNQQSRDIARIMEPARRQETYIEMIRDLGTNLKFNLSFLNLNPGIKEGGNSKKAYMLGKMYEVSANGEEKQDQLEEMKRNFSRVIWFTYRKNFPSLVSDQLPADESYISDTSWGCTIRSCQMLFAECLRKGLLSKNNGSKENEKKNSNRLNRQIIRWFLDNELDPKLAPYSIQKISSYIYEKSQILPGNWLKPSTVLYALQNIHQNYSRYTTQSFQMEIYIEGTIYLNQAVNKVGNFDNDNQELPVEDFEKEFEVIEDCEDFDEPKSPLSHQEKIFFSEPCEQRTIESLFEEDSAEVEKLLKIKWKQSLLIIVLAKIGLDRPNPEYLPFIKELLSFPECVGMLGGKPGLAYYIMGYIEDKLIYLDPHFVQEALKKRNQLNDEQYYNTYFCNSMRYLNLNDIDTSVGFSFWIKDEVEFEKFVKRFKNASKKKESFLCMEATAPEGNVTEFESVDGEDEFERLATKL